MSKFTVTVSGVKGIFIPFMTEDGAINLDAMKARFEECAAGASAEVSEDFDTMLASLTAALLDGKNTFRNISEPALERLLWNRKVRASALGTLPENERVSEDPTEEQAQHDRHAEVLGSLIRSRGDQFHVGLKSGVLIRYVDGEIKRDDAGNPMYDGNGNEIAHKRFSDTEWSEIKAKGAETAAKREEKKAAKDAAKAATK